MPEQSALQSYRDLINDATKILYQASDTPRIDAEVLIQHTVERPLSWLIAYGDTIATSQHSRDFYALVAQRQLGQPIAYLTGKRDFWTLRLSVDKNVLIPRPDTETLVDQALERLPVNKELRVLDLGTGSGAIALSIAKERPMANVLAVDSQDGAIKIARSNAQDNGISNTQFIQSNWFDKLDKNTKFDLIASNPPYIEANDPHLSQGDLRFEPSSALVAQDNGLADLNTIISKAPLFLAESGWLIVEHGYNQAQEVASLFAENGFMHVELYKDINDLPRCTAGKLNDD